MKYYKISLSYFTKIKKRINFQNKLQKLRKTIKQKTENCLKPKIYK